MASASTSGDSFLNDLNRQNLRPNVLKPLLQRLGAETQRADEEYDGQPPSPPGDNGGSQLVSARASAGGPSARRPASPSVGKRPSSGPPSARGAAPGASGGGWGSESAAASGGDEENVTPVPIYSEKELALEFSQIGEQLGHKTDWAVRNAALRRLQAIVLGGACEYHSFLGHLKGLREPLVAQVAELRSSLVREACAALVLISSTLREAFEPFVHEYFQPLIKQTVVTIQVIRESSNECVRALIIYTQPVKVAPKILASLNDRSASLRKNAIVYLLLLLENAPTHHEGERCALEKHADAILTILKTTLTDAVSEVRATSRTAFWAFHRHFPSRTSRLLPMLDGSTHKLVLEEQAHYERQRANGESNTIQGAVHGGSRGAVKGGASQKHALPERSGSAPGYRHAGGGGGGGGGGGPSGSAAAPPPLQLQGSGGEGNGGPRSSGLSSGGSFARRPNGGGPSPSPRGRPAEREQPFHTTQQQQQAPPRLERANSAERHGRSNGRAAGCCRPRSNLATGQLTGC